MTLLQQIKADQLSARKNQDSVKSSLLTTLLGEAEMIGKNDGNRTTTDAEVVAIIKKFVSNIDFTFNKCNDGLLGGFRESVMNEERAILVAYLPKQLTESELTAVITDTLSKVPQGSKGAMGFVMKELKAAHSGTYDGDLASKIVKQLLG